ncbi:MAG: glycosyltransferase [Nitrospirae bacterium]|nr:glycosyltransferase [Nitrospirota bacterium]
MDKKIGIADSKQMNLKQKIIDLLANGSKPTKPEPPPEPPPPPPISAYCDTAVLALDAIDIRGWALSEDGIKTVEVSIDGTPIGQAVYGSARPDIRAAFPESENALNSGFCLFKTLEPPLTEGNHQLETKITSNDGHIEIIQLQFDVTETFEAFSYNHPAMILSCDNVSLGLKSIDITGFAISAYPITRVDLSIDDIFIKKANIGISRLDVEQMYPCYKDSVNAGFCLYCKFDEPIAEGPHTITLQATAEPGIQGSRQFTFDAVEDTTPSIFIKCDETNLAVDAVEIKGFAVSSEKIAHIEVYIDDVFEGDASYKLDRADVAKAYPCYEDSDKSGFCFYKAYKMPVLAGIHTVAVKMPGSAGIHTVAVKVLTEGGHLKQWLKQAEFAPSYEDLTRKKPNILIRCDTELSAVDVIEITGWAASPEGIKEVEIYIDDIFIDKAVYGVKREEIGMVHPCYKDSANAGFCLYKTLDNPLSEGPHTITVAAATETGIKGSRQFTFDAVRDIPPVIVIKCDETNLASDAVEIRGFVVSSEKIAKIEVYIDDVFDGAASYGLERADVAKSYPCYKGSGKSGFCFYRAYDKPVSPGIHTVAVNATTEGGHLKQWQKQVEFAPSYEKLTRKTPNISIRCDTALLTFDVLDCSGWAVSPDGIKEIGIYIDGIFIDNAVCGASREAVGAIHPCYKGSANAGFCLYKTLKTPLSQGQHTLNLRVQTNNGLEDALEIVCKTVESYKSHSKLNPTFFKSFDMLLLTCEITKVRGWIVTPAGLTSVKIFVDGHYAGSAKIDIRNDITPLYPCYKHTERVFFYLDQIFETPLSTGRHVLTIKANALDRQTMSWDYEYENVEEYAIFLMRTNPEALIELDIARMSLDFIEVRGWALSPDGIDRVEVYLDNRFIDTAYYGFERGEMAETFTLYKAFKDGINCGFCLYEKLDEPLPAGYHTLKVIAISVTGLTKAKYEYNFITRLYRQQCPDVPAIILSCDKLLITPDVVEAEGWTSSPDGISSVEFYVDDVYIDKAFHGISTQEIGRLLPCYKNSSYSAFVLYNAYENNFTPGNHLVTLKITSETGVVRQWSTMHYIADSYEKYLERIEPLPLSKIKHIIDELLYRPKISIVTPVYNVAPQWLDKCIQSVIDQYYENWELCIYDDASTSEETIECLHKWKNVDARIKIAFGSVNMHISGATNEALKLAEGEFIALLDNDDELTRDALYENVWLLNMNPELDFIYSDEDKMEEDGTLCDPFFKPDWSPELFCSMMYTCHFGVYRKSIIDKINGFRKGYEGSQDYDMVLRFTEQTTPGRIAHIPKALYHWRKIFGSSSGNAQHKTYAFDSAMKALRDYIDRNSIEGEVINENNTGLYRIKRKLRETPLVSIIIPTKDKVEYLEKCVKSLIKKTEYPNVEIIVLDTGSVELVTHEFYNEIRQIKQVRIIDYPNPEFNYAEANNWAAARAQGPYLLFLNNDTEVIEPAWLSAMMEYGQLPEVGIVGAKLLYPDDGIQHMGVVVGLKRAASHVGRRYPDKKLMGFPYIHAKDVVRNVTAVTGACLLMRKALFDNMNGFDIKFRIAFNDIDLCLRVREEGYKVIYTPYAKLYHHESVSVGKPYEDTGRCPGLFEAEVELFRERWAIENYVDPFYNINLDESLRFKH